MQSNKQKRFDDSQRLAESAVEVLIRYLVTW